MLASLVIGGREWIAPAILLGLFATMVVVWRYSSATLDSQTRWLAASFKSIALVLLCLCLMEPLWSGQRARPGANLFAILADDSQSLTIRDPKPGSGAEANEFRGESLKRLLTNEKAEWQVRLAQDFDLRRYTFDGRLQSVTDFSRLEFAGSRSSLNAVLNNMKERFKDRPLAGALLFTDGISTDTGITSLDPKALPPIYPVIIGSGDGHRDLGIGHLSVTTTAFEDAPVTIQADVNHLGLAKSKVTARVIDEDGKVIKEEIQSFSSDSAPMAFRFQIKPIKPGLSFYEVKVESDAVPLDAESTAANNRRMVAIDRGAGPYRILYLSGRPNWEFKFLRRAIDSDEQIKMTGVIRVAKREPKFDWRSKDGEATNPLFRGFDRTTEETERYDQPVLVRLNTLTPNELRDGFPKKAEDLYQYHAVIVDDLEAKFFTADQLGLLERFVSERGGGLLMLGGAESFQNGGYSKTPVGRMLPVYLEGASSTSNSSEQSVYRLALTRDGWLQPWARLRSTETEEQQRLKELPFFRTLNDSGHLKPGASVIAEAIDHAGNKHPALAVQRFGRGRCSALLIGDLWRWQLERTDSQREKDDLGKAWRQMMRWLIADVPDQIELKIVEQEDSGQPLTRLEARIRTKDFLPQDNAAATMTLTYPDGSTVTQPAEPSLKEAGLYESTFAARQSGKYTVSVDVIDGDGKPLGKASTGWVTDPTPEEFQRVAPNTDLLTTLARQTGGEVIRSDDLESFVSTLSRRQAPLTEAYTTPLWHQTWVWLLIVGSLCAEWGFRRYRGLP